MYYKQQIKLADSLISAANYKEDFEQQVAKAQKVAVSWDSSTAYENIPCLSSVYNEKNVTEINRLARSLRGNFNSIFVLGMGGASLCGQALVSLLRRPYAPYGNDCKVCFMDTIDPYSVRELLANIDYKSTAFLIISKSGKTIETLSQAALVYHYVTQILGRKMQPGQFIVITDPKHSLLQEFADHTKAMILDHDPLVGGRYAIFTNVGLLPAALAGLDIQAICDGAAHILENRTDPQINYALEGAAIQAYLAKGQVKQSIFMPYSDQLLGMVEWAKQLYAEGLGKDGKGITPIKALGTMDQHSQLQLFLDGPKDKFFTIISAVSKIPHLEIKFPQGSAMQNNFLEGSTLAEILEAEYKATVQALIMKKCPLRTIEIGVLNEEKAGALAMQFMLETIILGGLLEINPYDQPAVDIGKRIAEDLLKQKQQEKKNV